MNVAAAHEYFAVDCFNKAWDLMDKPERTPDENRLMAALSQASIFHWMNRADCTSEKLSVGYWQASRLQALLGHATEARRQAETCLELSSALKPFFLGYAHEALARAELLDRNLAEADEHIDNARRLLAQIVEDEDRGLLLKDLDSLQSRRADVQAPLTG